MPYEVLQYGIWILFGAAVLYMLYQTATKGFKGAIVGGRVLKTYGEVEVPRGLAGKARIKVHKLAANGGSKIGVELKVSAFLGFEVMGFTLTKNDATRLVQLLSNALSDA